jgi:hypothetical protein
VVGVEGDLMLVGAVAIHHMQQEYGLRPIVGLCLVLGTSLIEQNGLGRNLARRGEHDAAVGQIARPDIMSGRDRVIGQLRDGLRRGVI